MGQPLEHSYIRCSIASVVSYIMETLTAEEHSDLLIWWSS